MKKTKDFSLQNFLLSYAIVIILLALSVVTAIFNPTFFSINNLKNIGINTAPRFLIALGVSGCLITRGTDLSAGRMVGLAACIAGTLLQSVDYAQKFFPNLGNIPVIVVLLITVALCGVFGMANGLVISKLKVPPFIATLGMQTIVYGACLVYTGAVPLGGYRREYTHLATMSFGPVPLFVIIAIVVGALMWFLYNKTRHGKYMYAIGGNESAAEVSGVNVSRTLVKIYTLAAILYACGGFLIGSKAGGANVNTGFGYELEAIASCTIGGVSTTGGIGRVSGILIGVLVFEILKTALQFLKVDTSYQYIVQGFVIVIAVALDLRRYLAKK